jgi:hypothetical protein
MPRILRNYLISFVIIGLIILAVQLINRWAEQQPAPTGATPPAAGQAQKP